MTDYNRLPLDRDTMRRLENAEEMVQKLLNRRTGYEEFISQLRDERRFQLIGAALGNNKICCGEDFVVDAERAIKQADAECKYWERPCGPGYCQNKVLSHGDRTHKDFGCNQWRKK